MTNTQTLQQLKEINPLALENLVQKLRVGEKRRRSFGLKGTHYTLRKIEKRLKNNPPQENPDRIFSVKRSVITKPINSYRDLSDAILTISHSNANYEDYTNVNGVDKSRLMIAQILRDKGVHYTVQDIIDLSYDEIQRIIK